MSIQTREATSKEMKKNIRTVKQMTKGMGFDENMGKVNWAFVRTISNFGYQFMPENKTWQYKCTCSGFNTVSHGGIILKERVSKKQIIIVTGIVLVMIIFFALLIAAVASLFKAEEEQITQVGQYESVLGAEGKYKENYVAYNDIFPDSLENVSQVREFIYQYYNPWDANYFGYLVCQYSEEEFEKEVSRLNALERAAYKGVYGIKEFPYEVCAVYADKVYGVIYALADKEANEIIYVSLEFCNYFTDIDYEEMMDKKYLPVGFNAKPGNETRKAFDAR